MLLFSTVLNSPFALAVLNKPLAMTLHINIRKLLPKHNLLKKRCYKWLCLIYSLEINFPKVLWTFQKTKKDLSIELIEASIGEKKNYQFYSVYMNVDNNYMIWPAYTGVWRVSYTLHSHDKRKPLWSVLETMEFYGKTFVFKEQVFGVFYINSCGPQTFQDYAKQTNPSSPWILVFPSVIHRLNVCSFSQSVWLARCFSLSVNVKSRPGEGLNIVKAWHTCSVWNIPSHSVSMTNVYILYRAVPSSDEVY